MKHNYAFFALACAIAAAPLAGAATYEKAQFDASQRVKNSMVSMTKKIDAPVQTPRFKAEGAVTAQDVAGTYDLTYIDELQDSYGAAEVVITAVNDTEIECVGFYKTYPFKGSVKPDGTVEFPEQFVVYVSSYDEDMYLRHYTWKNGYSGIEASDAPFSGVYADGAIVFDEDDLFVLEGNANGTWTGATDGYYAAWDTFAMAKQAPEEPEDPTAWEEDGTADLIDGWVYTCYGLDQTQYPVLDVALQKKAGEEGVYRLVDPFKGDHMVYADGYNESTEVGYLQVNIEDEEYPYVYNGVKAGFKNSNGDFFCYDANGYYHLIGGYAKAVVIQSVTDGSLSTYDKEAQVMNIPQALFGITANKDGGYSWQDKEGNSIDMKAEIKFHFKGSSVNTLSTSVNGEAEYYNLQGMRVSEPSNGSLYIRRIGSDVQKVIVIR